MPSQWFDASLDFGEMVDLLKGWEKKSNSARARIMKVVAEMLRAAVEDRYETQGDGQWPEHAPATKEKRRGQGDYKLLQDTGVLAGSTDTTHGPEYAEASTNVSYVVYHLEGGPIIPKRNPFEISDDAFSEIEREIAALVADEVFDG